MNQAQTANYVEYGYEIDWEDNVIKCIHILRHVQEVTIEIGTIHLGQEQEGRPSFIYSDSITGDQSYLWGFFNYHPQTFGREGREVTIYELYFSHDDITADSIPAIFITMQQGNVMGVSIFSIPQNTSQYGIITLPYWVFRNMTKPTINPRVIKVILIFTLLLAVMITIVRLLVS